MELHLTSDGSILPFMTFKSIHGIVCLLREFTLFAWYLLEKYLKFIILQSKFWVSSWRNHFQGRDQIWNGNSNRNEEEYVTDD